MLRSLPCTDNLIIQVHPIPVLLPTDVPCLNPSYNRRNAGLTSSTPRHKNSQKDIPQTLILNPIMRTLLGWGLSWVTPSFESDFKEWPHNLNYLFVTPRSPRLLVFFLFKCASGLAFRYNTYQSRHQSGWQVKWMCGWHATWWLNFGAYS